MPPQKPQSASNAAEEETMGQLGEKSTAGGDEQTRRVLEELLPRLRGPSLQSAEESPVSGVVERLASIPELVAAAPAEANRILGQYELLECIGRGGMGEVYRARHRKLGQIVAIKVVRSDLAWNGATRQRFEQEMRALGRLGNDEGSEYVVRPLHADEQDGTSYLVMEFIAGQSLSDVADAATAAQQPLPISTCCEYIRQAALGLDFAHRHGIVHRDIKPSNLLVDGRGRVRILDLGLARITQESFGASNAPEITCSGQIMGTPDYMAPEQIRDSRETDARTDIYALGATLYKLLTGAAPYAGSKYRTLENKLFAIADGKPKPISEVRADVPAGLAAIVHRMLAKRPEDRFATPVDVVHALEPFCGKADLTQPLEPQVISRASAPESTVVPATKVGDAGRNNSRGWHYILAGAAGFLALAAILLIVTRNGTVEVTSPDGKLPDDVKVVVSQGGKEVELLQADNQWSAKIVNGEYRVHVGKGSDRFEIKNSTLIVNRMGRAIVKVELKPGTESPDAASSVAIESQPGTSPKPDRRAAEWVLSVGGDATIKTKYEELPVRRIEDLPTKDFKLLDVDLKNVAEFDDSGMIAFDGCTNIRSFQARRHVGDSGIAYLRACLDLRRLILFQTGVTDNGLATFKDCKRLESLVLEGTKVGSGLAHFDGCRDLLHLGLSFTHVGDEDLMHFEHCTKLVHLNLRHTKVTDRGLEHFKNCEFLTDINLEAMNITDEGLRHFSRCKTLQGLSIVQTHVSDEGLAFLEGYPNLSEINVGATKVTEAGVKKLSSALPNCTIRWDGGVIEPTSIETPDLARPHPDREKPFVVVNRAGEVRGEYRFVTECLPILQEDEILEVHGNGPFKLPQIVRDKLALHIRAGKGYRPQFVMGFPTTEEPIAYWFRVLDAALTVEGCDFVATPRYGAMIFGGSGDEWTLRRCRLIQSYTGHGMVSFTGRRLSITDSFIACNATYNAFGLGVSVKQVQFENNILSVMGTLFGIDRAQDGDRQADVEFQLHGNLISGPAMLFGIENTPNSGPGRIRIRAEHNVWRDMKSLVGSGEKTDLRTHVEWTGTDNVLSLIPGQFLIWQDENGHTETPQTVETWNAYWNDSDDLRQEPKSPFVFEALDAPDWTEGARFIRQEVSEARGRHAMLADLGPDVDLIGPGDGYRRALKHDGAERDAPLEGGPFVLLRDNSPVAGYVALDAAVADTKAGDVIEIRSDGTFPRIQATVPPDRRLTLRAAPGYHPILTGLSLAGGDWTLEGLHVRQPDQPPSQLAFTARRVANCAIEGGSHRQLVILQPPGLDLPVEIVNCYLPDGIISKALHVRIDDTIARSVRLEANGEASVECRRICLWSRTSAQHGSDASIQHVGEGRFLATLTDCLIESDYVLAAGDVAWQGERNLYRVHSGMWGTFTMPDGKPEAWRRTLDEWRAIWNSDADSQYEESVLLRPHMWRH